MIEKEVRSDEKTEDGVEYSGTKDRRDKKGENKLITGRKRWERSCTVRVIGEERRWGEQEGGWRDRVE